MELINFNKPYLTGKETSYIQKAVEFGKISGDGKFTELCHAFFEKKYGFKKVMLTTSCTDALEMAAILLNIKEGDEIIAPSFTFVSTVNAFVLRGAKIVFVDCSPTNPNMDATAIEQLIGPKTKAIIPVHYAGIACDMDKIMTLADKYKLFVVEDAAHAIDSYYKGKPLGSIGHLATFSFHETKNIISGEGGMLVINDAQFLKRAEIIREKGTNRSEFFRGEVNKYGWVDIGSSFLPSDIIAAFLYAQIENMDDIQNRRKEIWKNYSTLLQPLENKNLIEFAKIPDYASNNGHLFYILCKSNLERSNLISHLKKQNINAVFHYLSLHKSAFHLKNNPEKQLPQSDYYSDCLLRLPFYYELSFDDQQRIVNLINSFYQS